MYRHRPAVIGPLHLTFFLVIALGMLAGCKKPLPALIQPQRIEHIHRDLSPLQGKRIVIDPGHGGRFSGAVGARGLRESDVNLAVGLHLWGLLHEAGAEVRLTRTVDVDLVPSPSGSLKDDLNARAQLSNNVNAHLFISIHHNSNTHDPKMNNLQIFYKLNDPGTSYDVAQCLAEELGKHFPPHQIFVLPGNYRVLRETNATAVLGEASFLSHQLNEERLSLSNQLRREAEDYFAGILAYFRKGIPTVVELNPDGTTLENAWPTLKARLKGGAGNQEIDPKTTAIILNGFRVPGTYDPETGTITHVPEKPLPNGDHTFSVLARNRNGNAIQPNQGRFHIAVPVERLLVSSTFSLLPLGEDVSTRIEVQAFDRNGNPVADGTRIALSTSGGRLDRNTTSTDTGRGIAYFFPPEAADEIEITAQSSGIVSRATIRCGTVNHALVRLTITDPDRTPLEGVRVSTGGSIVGTSDRYGQVFLRAAHTGKTSVTLSKRGFLDGEALLTFKEGLFLNELLSLTPHAGGVLLNRTITIDPEPWDERFSPENGLKRDAEEENIAVALQLQALLDHAGARTILTRQSLAEKPTLGDRLRAGEQALSEYYITVTHRTKKSSVAHYFNSTTGRELARHIAAAMQEECALKKVAVHDAAEFTIIQPSCPSVLVNFGSYKISQTGETALREAQAVYEGLVRFLRGAPGRNK